MANFIFRRVIKYICITNNKDNYMDIQSSNYSLSFQSRIISSQALKDTYKYAKDNGLEQIIEETQKSIKNKENLKLKIKHNYSKMLNVCKTEISYTKRNLPCKYVETSSKSTNPAEVTFNIIKNLLDKNSKVYQSIFG